MISKILVSTIYQKQKNFGAVVLEGRVLIYLFLAFLARQVVFRSFLKRQNVWISLILAGISFQAFKAA